MNYLYKNLEVMSKSVSKIDFRQRNTYIIIHHINNLRQCFIFVFLVNFSHIHRLKGRDSERAQVVSLFIRFMNPADSILYDTEISGML